MALGTWTPPSSGTAGSFDPRNHADKPLIVVVREFRENFTTRKYPNPKNVIIVDVVDILADTVHVSVIWGSAAIVDRLKDQAPKPGEQPQRLPVVIRHVASASTGRTYTTVDPLEGKALELAAAWDAKYPTRIDDERAARQSEVREAAQRYDNGDQTGAPPGPAFQGLSGGQQQTPAQTAPQQQAPASQPQQPVQQQAPAPQQPQPSVGMSDDALEAAIASLA